MGGGLTISTMDAPKGIILTFVEASGRRPWGAETAVVARLRSPSADVNIVLRTMVAMCEMTKKYWECVCQKLLTSSKRGVLQQFVSGPLS